jgi:hypothetical protein
MERLSQLRYELCTDKPFRKLTDSSEDAASWNEAIDKLESQIGSSNMTWFKGPWLFAECYMYRRIREAMMLSQTGLKNLDPFEWSKNETHESNVKNVFQLINSVCPLNFEEEKTNFDVLKRRYQIILEVNL